MLVYKLKAIFGMKYKEFFKTIDCVHEKTNKSKISIFFDIITCTIKYGAGHNDYRIFEFYNMKPENRDTYLTRFRNKKIVEYLNDTAYREYFNDKSKFTARFSKYLKRDFGDIEKMSLEEFTKFIEKNQTIFCKPYKGDSGRGIEKLSLNDFKNAEAMYNYIKEKKIGVIEGVIKQHEGMAKVNPYAVNCMRLVTVVKPNKEVDVVYGVVKFGCTESFVDNMGFGAVSAPIDLETGKISADAQTCTGVVYKKHPVSNIEFKGFQIPLFNEAKELVKKAALEVPQIRQVGLDICIGEKEPIIIEGNEWSDYMFWQLPAQTPNKIGLMPYYRKLLPELHL